MRKKAKPIRTEEWSAIKLACEPVETAGERGHMSREEALTLPLIGVEDTRPSSQRITAWYVQQPKALARKKLRRAVTNMRKTDPNAYWLVFTGEFFHAKFFNVLCK